MTYRLEKDGWKRVAGRPSWAEGLPAREDRLNDADGLDGFARFASAFQDRLALGYEVVMHLSGGTVEIRERVP